MPTNRTVTLPAAWAANGVELPISGAPVQGVTYIKSALVSSAIAAGWPFATINESATFNEVLFRATSLLRLLEQWGVLPWSPATSYLISARAMGSNGKIYRALVNTVGHDPVSSPTKWADDTADSLIPSGTKMVFVQASAPVGWTIDTTATYNAAGLRIVTGAGGGDTGGSSDAFAAHTHTTPAHTHTSSFAVAGHALTIEEMPAHTHNVSLGYNLDFGTAHARNVSPQSARITPTSSSGGGVHHTHGLTGGITSSGAGASGTFAPKYINSIVCIRG